MLSKCKRYISYRIKVAALFAAIYMLAASMLLFAGRLWLGIPCLFLVTLLLSAWGIYKMVAEPYDAGICGRTGAEKDERVWNLLFTGAGKHDKPV